MEQGFELTEHVGLRERAKDGDFITKDLARWPRDTSRRRVDAINNYKRWVVSRTGHKWDLWIAKVSVERHIPLLMEGEKTRIYHSPSFPPRLT